MNTILLGRRYDGCFYEESLEAMRAGWKVHYSLEDLKEPSLIIPRYCVEPFSRDFFAEIGIRGHKVVWGRDHSSGSTKVMCYDVYNRLNTPDEDQGPHHPEGLYVPRLWRNASDLPEDTSFVVKGQINSRKYTWDDDMFAQNKQDAIRVMCRLQDDSMIGIQPIVFKEYKELVKLGEAPRGLPISLEYRFFFYGDKLLSCQFYWASHPELAPPEVPKELLEMAMKYAENLRQRYEGSVFLSFDLALMASGGVMLVEHNSFYQAGLGLQDPYEFYNCLKGVLTADGFTVSKNYSSK